MLKKVQVLLSSHNGEKFIAQQIDSILGQKNVDVGLLIRDDGSADGTLDIVERYARGHLNIRYYAGENAGVQKSFFDLMAHAAPDADYYAFSDQDDFWHGDKLGRAVELLEACPDGSQPLLYAGRPALVDERLGRPVPLPDRRTKGASFGNALVENICSGCTEVFNGALLRLAAEHPPACPVLHDWWLYLTAACFGRVVYDDSTHISYRQHGGNAVGMPGSLPGRWKRRIRGVAGLKGTVSRQARDFYRAYGTFGCSGVPAGLVLNYKKSWRGRCRLAADRRIYRQRRVDDILYRILFLAGYL